MVEKLRGGNTVLRESRFLQRKMLFSKNDVVLDGVGREVHEGTHGIEVKMIGRNQREQLLSRLLFADNAVLVLSQQHRARKVCQRRMLGVKAAKKQGYSCGKALGRTLRGN